jgi:hypothetical protein
MGKADLYIRQIYQFGIFLLIGFIGHGITTLISILEGISRYLFGQNEFARPIDSVIQIIRMLIIFGLNFLLFSFVSSKYNIQISIGISTVYIVFPGHFLFDFKGHFVFSLIFPGISGLISFSVSFLMNTISLKFISYFCLVRIFLFEVFFPFALFHHRYFLFHFRLIRSFFHFSILKITHQLTFLIITPLFLSRIIYHLNLNEVPTYLTLEISLKKDLFSLIQTGRLGCINSGDIFFQSKPII